MNLSDEIEAKQKAKDLFDSLWDKASEDERRYLIQHTLDTEGPDAVKELFTPAFVGIIESMITGVPAKEEKEVKENKNECEITLNGIPVTLDQLKEILPPTEHDKDEDGNEIYVKEEYLKVDDSVDKNNTYLVLGWMDWPGGESFIKDIDLNNLKAQINSGIRDSEILMNNIELTDEASDGGFLQAKHFTKNEAESIVNLLNSVVCTDTENPIILGENDNAAISIADYLKEANSI